MTPAATPDADALDALNARLARIESLLRIGFAEQVAERREREDLDDEVVSAILGASRDWIKPGELKERVRKATAKSPRTIEGRIEKLLDAGALEGTGETAQRRYRNTGLLG